MNYDDIIKGILAYNEDAILSIPKDETFDFIEYILDNYKEEKERIFNIAWYLESSVNFIEMIRNYPDDKTRLTRFIESSYDRSERIISSLLRSNNHNIGYLIKNMETIINLDHTYIKYYLEYAIDHKMTYIIEYLMNNENLEIRGVTLTYLISNHYAYYKSKYSNNIEDYLSIEKKRIPERYASLITSFLSVYDEKEYYKMLKYVLENYESNTILSRLTDGSLDYYLGHKDTTNISYYQEQQALKDIDILFNSYSGNRYVMYEKYGKHLNPTTQKRYDSVKRFYDADLNTILSIFSSSLYEELMDVIEKYTKDTTGKIKVAGRGSRSTAFIVGDKVIKCGNGKWYQSKTTSVSSYLILKNIEEHYEYDAQGKITSAIEVQPYLKGKASIFKNGIIDKYKEALKAEGYACEDLLIRSMFSYQNLRYLNDYHEADCDDPENLPEWFKKKPMVLIDADEVIKIR